MADLRKWIFQNWYLKLFALLAAFLLWSTYTSEPAVEVGYAVRLEFRNVAPNLEISGEIPTQVRVQLRGRSMLLRRISAADLGISVDLAGARPGDLLIRLTPNMVPTPYGATVVRLAPAEFHLTLAARN